MQKSKYPGVTVLFVALVVGVLWASPAWAPEGPPDITVHKFHDVDRDGVQEAGEEDIAGWLIRIYVREETGWHKEGEDYTDDFGTVTFTGLGPVDYLVWEEARDCWEPTTPEVSGPCEGGYYVVCSLASVAGITIEPTPVTVEFGNVYTCGGAGCTPGFWKNHVEEWVGYSPNDYFDEVFGVDEPHITLEEALWVRGGKIGKLARHGTAALLSAAHPEVAYPLTESQVIEAVRAGDADSLVDANELGALGFCD